MEPSLPMYHTSMVLWKREMALTAPLVEALPAGANTKFFHPALSYQYASLIEPSAPMQKTSMLLEILETAEILPLTEALLGDKSLKLFHPVLSYQLASNT